MRKYNKIHIKVVDGETETAIIKIRNFLIKDLDELDKVFKEIKDKLR